MSSRNQLLLAIAIALGISTWYFFRKPTAPIKQEITSIIIGTNSEFPPFSFMNDKNELDGFDIDVAKEIAQRIDKPYELKDMSFNALIPEIQLGTIHMIAAGMTPSPERAKRVLFTTPHFGGDQLVIVTMKNAQKISSVDDLKGKEVIVNQGYTADDYLSQFDNINVTRIASAMVSDGVLAIKSKRADAYVAAQSSLKPFFDKYSKTDFNITPIQGTKESAALAISRKYPDLFEMVEKEINNMLADGTIDRIAKKWNLK